MSDLLKHQQEIMDNLLFSDDPKYVHVMGSFVHKRLKGFTKFLGKSNNRMTQMFKEYAYINHGPISFRFDSEAVEFIKFLISKKRYRYAFIMCGILVRHKIAIWYCKIRILRDELSLEE